MNYRITLFFLLCVVFTTQGTMTALPTTQTKSEVDNIIKEKDDGKQGRWFSQIKESISNKLVVVKKKSDTKIEKNIKILSITSLVLGILSFLFLGPLTSIPAIILAVLALNKLKRFKNVGESEKRGLYRGLAIAGLAIGIANIALYLVLIAIVLLSII